MIEVLISVGILSIGLLGVAALIPVGKLAMIETEKSDRTGACGRAALQEVRVRGMCNPDLWQGVVGTISVAVIDPLGYTTGTAAGQFGATNLGGTSTSPLPRRTLTTTTSTATAEALCRWPDDLSFSRPDEITAGTATVGTRPVPAAVDVNGNPE
ncbi:MAG: hypothetical protein ABFC77_02455, partial [Thermoguttaceae bacterium]